MSREIPHPIPPQLAELIAQRFRVIGDANRIRILDVLRTRELSVGELAAEVGTSQQNVSRHLGVLHVAGILGRERDGNRVLYSIADPSIFRLCEDVCGGLERHLAGIDELLGRVA